MRTARNLKGFLIIFASAFLLVATFATFATFATVAQAKVTEDQERLWKIMTYQELMRLSPAARSKYLKGLREAVIEFESNQQTNGDKFARETSSAQYLLWKALIDEADAKPFDASCPNSLMHTRAMQAAQQKHMGLFICMPPNMKSCPALKGGFGFHNVGSFQGRIVCYEPSASYVKQKQADRANKLKQQKAQAAKQKHIKELQIAAKKEKEHLAESARIKALTREKQKALARRKSEGPVSSKDAKDANGASDPTSGDDGQDPLAPKTDDQVARDKLDHDASVGSAEAPAIVDSADVHANELAVVDPKYDHDDNKREGHSVKLRDENEDLGTVQRGHECGPPPPIDKNKCNNQTIADARRQTYKRADLPHCLIGGNLSHFASGTKRPGNCQAPSEFCFNRLTCRDPNGAKREGAFVNFQCDKPKQVICNPYLFSVKPDGKPLCVEHTGHEVAACDSLATKMQTDAGPTSVIQRAKDDTSVIEGWNEFAGELNEMCFTEPTASVYCGECQILKKRAWELRLVAEGTTQDSPDCYKMIKLTSPNSSATQGPANSDATTAPAQ